MSPREESVRVFLMKLEQLAQQLDMTVDRLTEDRRRPAPDTARFSHALERIVREWSERFGIAAAYRASSEHPVDVPTSMAAHLYCIVREALHNVAKHARATSVTVSLARRDGRTVLLIQDDGQGFEPSAGPRDSGALGLVSMRERAALAG
jgi:two-component system sensor histidine kinase UhpB